MNCSGGSALCHVLAMLLLMYSCSAFTFEIIGQLI